MNLFMKTILIGLFCLPLAAQPTLTRDNFQQNGDTFNMLGVDPGTFTPNAGNGQNWDLSDFTRKPDEDYLAEFFDTASQGLAGQFPNANQAYKFTDNEGVVGWTIYYIDDEKWEIQGISAADADLIVNYQDPGIQFTFPFGFGDTSQDDFESDFVSNGVPIDRMGTIDTEYIGSGNITTESGTFNNVALIKVIQDITDTTSAQGFTIRIHTVTTSYLWYDPSNRWPVFILNDIVVETITDFSTDVIEARSAFYLQTDDSGGGGGGGGGGGDDDTRWISHITTPGNGFESSLYIQNTTNAAANIKVHGFDSLSNLLGTVEESIPAGGFKVVAQSAFSASTSHMSLEGCDTCVVSVGYKAENVEGAGTAHVGAETSQGKDLWIYPGEWDVLFDGIAIVNVGDAAASVTARQYDQAGNASSPVTLTGSLAPGAKYLTLLESHFQNAADSRIRITSDQPMVTLFLRGSRDGRYLFQTVPNSGEDDGPAERWISHITIPGNGFESTLFVQNGGSATDSLTITQYNASGASLGDVSATIGAGEYMEMPQGSWFNAATTHLKVSGCSDCQVTVGYKAENVVGAGTAHVGQVTNQGTSLWVYPGEWDVLFDGIAIVNVGASAASLTATQYRADGSEVKTVPLTSGLAPNAKYLTLLETHFNISEGTVIRIQSDQPIVSLFLRGSRNGQYLFQTVPF